ncbi:MAG: amino acid adenylation domain-containing protein [Terasakiella sp.]|uniref:amino acid adenylation domain-containing protein n=1 Tax=unclassified Terasakiella TaxID=2614952 RepID=UPI003B002DBE
MSMESLLLTLKKSAIRLRVDGPDDQLKFEAPKGAVTPALRDEIKANKAELIAFLKKNQQAKNKTDLALSPMDRTQGVPLSFAQQRLWFLYNLEGKSAAYNIPACRRLTGYLNINCLERALNSLAMRHEILRTNFTTIKEHGEQIIAPNRVFTIATHDIRDLDENAQQSVLDQHIQTETGYAFDLERDPLLRLSLVQTDDNAYLLCLVLHHIIGDGWSLEILIRELSQLYDAYLNDQDPDLPVLDIQYADFALWQRQWTNEGGLDRQLDYWKKALANIPPLLELPYDRARPKQQSYHGGLVNAYMKANLKNRLETFCKQENASFYMGLCATMNSLIHKYMGHDDLVIGTHTAGRTRREQEALIGFFINTLPLRTDLSGNPGFREILKRTAQSARGVFSHQDVPFEKLVDLVQPERDMSYAPLVQVMCVLQNMPISNDSFQGVEIEGVPLARDTAKFDLSLLAEEQIDGTLHCEFEYNADLFDEKTIQDMADHFFVLLEKMLATPDKAITEIGLLDQNITPPSKTPLIKITIVDAFEQQVEASPIHSALIHNDKALSYRELNIRANKLAHFLLAHGLQNEEVVALYMDNSIEAIVSILAILKAGGCYVALDTNLPVERLHYILTDANARFVLSTNSESNLGDTLHCISLTDARSQIDQQTESNPKRALNPDQLAYIIYTSGSTGTPKGVMIEHHSVIDLVDGLQDRVYHDLPDHMNIALMAALVFDASVQQVFGALLQGHSLHLCDTETKQDGHHLLTFLKDHQIQLSDGTPTLLHIMLDAGLGEIDNLPLRHLLIGGEALPQYQAQRLKGTSIDITNIYGPTECCVDVLAFTQSQDYISKNRTAFVPIGTPLGDCRAYILDPAGNPVPCGIDGELYISGPALFRGYVNLDTRTRAVRIPNPFAHPDDTAHQFMYRTGDICHQLKDGNIVFVRRNDDQVKIRGYRIELGDIEANLMTCDGVKKACVIAKDRGAKGQELHAFVEMDRKPDIAELHRHLKTRIADYMIPAHFFHLKELPVNKSGKIDRKTLAHMNAETIEAKTAFTAPQTEEQRLLCDMLSDILGRDQISITDNFFYLGGDSIKALQIVARLHQKQYKLDVRDLFNHPIIADLALKLCKIEEEKQVLPAFKTGDAVPLTAIQHWFFENYTDPRHHFNQSVLLTSKSRLDENRLKQSLQTVLANHDAFRLKFRRDGDQFIQYIGTVNFGFTSFNFAPDLPNTQALQEKVDLTGQTIQVGLFRTDTKDYLFITAHHLIIDAVSWRTLFEELETIYNTPTASLSPPPVAFSHWAKTINTYATKTATNQLTYWQEIDQQAQNRPLIHDFEQNGCTHADCEVVETTLPEKDTARLLGDIHETFNSRIDDFLLCALSRAFGPLADTAPPALMLESHGREALDNGLNIGANVGWLTSMYPVLLPTITPDRCINLKHVKEVLRNIPQKGMGYGLLRYLANQPLMAAPEISFNYLGQFDEFEEGGFFSLSERDVAPNISPNAPQPFLIEVIALITKGKLNIKIGFSTRHYHSQTIVDFLHRFKDELQHMITEIDRKPERELTPSDIDYCDFNQDELDRFIDGLNLPAVPHTVQKEGHPA